MITKAKKYLAKRKGFARGISRSMELFPSHNFRRSPIKAVLKKNGSSNQYTNNVDAQSIESDWQQVCKEIRNAYVRVLSNELSQDQILQLKQYIEGIKETTDYD